MTNIFVLILLLGNGNAGGVAMQEFGSLGACEYALSHAKALADKSRVKYLTGTCVPKLKK